MNSSQRILLNTVATYGRSLLALALALWLCSLVWGWAIGPVAWFGLLSTAALGFVFLLPYAPRFAAWLAVIGPLLALPPFFL